MNHAKPKKPVNRIVTVYLELRNAECGMRSICARVNLAEKRISNIEQGMSNVQ